MLDRQEGTDQVDAQDFGPVVGGQLEHVAVAAADAGIGVGDIQLAELGDHGLHRLGDIGFQAGVAGHPDRLAARVGDHLCGVFHRRGPVEAEHLGAFLGEQPGAGAADAARRAGDQCNLAFQTRHDRFSRVRTTV